MRLAETAFTLFFGTIAIVCFAIILSIRLGILGLLVAAFLGSEIIQFYRHNRSKTDEEKTR